MFIIISLVVTYGEDACFIKEGYKHFLNLLKLFICKTFISSRNNEILWLQLIAEIILLKVSHKNKVMIVEMSKNI